MECLRYNEILPTIMNEIFLQSKCQNLSDLCISSIRDNKNRSEMLLRPNKYMQTRHGK